MRNDPLARWADLFADGDLGLFTLPPDLLALRSTVVNLDRELERIADQAPDPAAAREELQRGCLTAARGGQDWPDPAPVVDVERAAQLHAARRQALTGARAAAADELLRAVEDHADTLITEHLRPAFDTAAGAR
jgi:hypothetical protein